MHSSSLWKIISFEKYSLAVTVKQPVECMKQLVVLPLPPLNKAGMTDFVWLQLFLLFKTSCW